MFVSRKQKRRDWNEKEKLKNVIKKVVVGVALACSLLTVMGSVSNEGIMPCAEVAAGDSIIE